MKSTMGYPSTTSSGMRRMAAPDGPSFASLGFQALTPLLFYSATSPPVADDAAASPSISPDGAPYDLVMIWGWMNASPRHLVKYVQLHRSLQPGIPIIFAQSTTASLMGLTGDLHRSLPMIHDVVKGLPENPKIFVHAFSNGGLAAFADFLALYRRNEGSALPVSALLIDSAPGGTKFPSSLTSSVHAFLEVFRDATLRAMMTPIVYLIVLLLYGPPMLLGLEGPIGKIRRVLNDETLVSEDSVRGYIYCKGDAIVGWEDIVEHADQACERGWKVLQAGFDGGNHVGGYRYHREEYINFVRRLRGASASSTT
ncbi:hypothetical protein Dda_5734 [Drechslerella dactyloides]|uniref:Indole-diterpene biosynthesis protein PaxU n=1 Tax=Drechslerella dactyloides TaxID=74499 RepID=A0AAD6IWN1_DREDA|nr:hypothetical protein Dda_5734 [Drechslerella dactyloides]